MSVFSKQAEYNRVREGKPVSQISPEWSKIAYAFAAFATVLTKKQVALELALRKRGVTSDDLKSAWVEADRKVGGPVIAESSTDTLAALLVHLQGCLTES
jgi:hypothetical protein